MKDSSRRRALRSTGTAGKSRHPLEALPTSEERNPPRNTHTHTQNPRPTLTPTTHLFPSQWGVKGKLGPLMTLVLSTHTHTQSVRRTCSVSGVCVCVCLHRWAALGLRVGCVHRSQSQSFVVKFIEFKCWVLHPSSTNETQTRHCFTWESSQANAIYTNQRAGHKRRRSHSTHHHHHHLPVHQLYSWLEIKGTVHPEIITLSSFTHHQAVSKLYEYFQECW